MKVTTALVFIGRVKDFRALKSAAPLKGLGAVLNQAQVANFRALKSAAPLKVCENLYRQAVDDMISAP